MQFSTLYHKYSVINYFMYISVKLTPIEFEAIMVYYLSKPTPSRCTHMVTDYGVAPTQQSVATRSIT